MKRILALKAGEQMSQKQESLIRTALTAWPGFEYSHLLGFLGQTDHFPSILIDHGNYDTTRGSEIAFKLSLFG